MILDLEFWPDEPPEPRFTFTIDDQLTSILTTKAEILAELQEDLNKRPIEEKLRTPHWVRWAYLGEYLAESSKITDVST